MRNTSLYIISYLSPIKYNTLQNNILLRKQIYVPKKIVGTVFQIIVIIISFFFYPFTSFHLFFHPSLHMAGTSVCEILLLQCLFLQVLILCLFTQRKMATVCFPVDCLLIQLHFLKNRSCEKSEFIILHTKNYWRLLVLNPVSHW